MKKILLFTLGMLIFSQAQANNLNSNQIQDYLKTSQVETISDAYSEQNVCESERTRFNREYPSYTRSACFLNNSQYFYFICASEFSCNLENISELQKQTSQTSANTNGDNVTPQTANLSLNPNVNIPNKSKLDTFLKNVQKKGESFNDDAKYDRFLDALEKQLTTLKNKYSKNTTIQNMTNYLISGVENIRVQKSQNQALLAEKSEIDKFFCELAGNETCENKPQNSSGNLVNAGTGNISNTGSQTPRTGSANPIISTGSISTNLSPIQVVDSYAAYKQGNLHVRYAFDDKILSRNIIMKMYGTSQATFAGNKSMSYELNLKNYLKGDVQFLNFNLPNEASFFNIKDTGLFALTPWTIEIYDEDNKKTLSKFQLGLLESITYWKTTKEEISYGGTLPKSNTKIVNNNFRLTYNKYQGNFLAFGDVCTQEFGNDWTIDYRGEGIPVLFTESKEDIWNNHSRFYQKLDSLRTSYDVYNGGAHCKKGETCYPYQQRPAVHFYKVACKKHNNQEIPKVSDSIQITKKGYPAGFGNIGRNVCQEEFGNGWNVSRDEKTFENINISQPIWFTGMGSMGGCEEYTAQTRGIHHLNGHSFISNCSIGANQQIENFNHRVVCERKSFDLDVLNTQSFREKLTPVNFPELENFIGTIKNELNSKIEKKDGFIFINNQIAITEKQHSLSEIGNIGTNVCPTGYVLNPGYQRDGLSGMFDKYTLEALGWYYSQHGNNKPGSSTVNPFITYDFLTNSRTLSRIRLSNGYSYWRMPAQGNYYLSSASDTVGIDHTSTEKYTVLCQVINRNSVIKNYFEPKVKNTYIIQDTNQISGYTSGGAETYLLYGFQHFKADQSQTGNYDNGVQRMSDNRFSRMQYYLPINNISGTYQFYFHDKNN